MSQPRTGTVPSSFLQYASIRLGFPPSLCGIRSQLPHPLNNRTHPIRSTHGLHPSFPSHSVQFPIDPYHVGDQVWLEGKNLRTSFPSYKLTPRRHGPFTITSIIQGTSCRLDLPPSWKIHPVFHASLLSPYRETSAHGPNFTRPPPELIDGDAHYEVEEILDSRFFRNRLQYLVKWVGYPDSENLWLAASELSSAPDLVSSFHLSHPTAASPSVRPLPRSILKTRSS